MVLVTDRIHIYDSYLFMQEYLSASKIIPMIYIESPLIKGFNYYLKASGVYASFYGLTFGDQLRTEDFVDMLLKKESRTDIRIITASPEKNKYTNIFDTIGELEFLLFLAKKQAKIYFLPLSQHHKKYFITNFGVLTGSANYTASGRYLVPQTTLFFERDNPTYDECLADFRQDMKKAENKETNTIKFLQDILSPLKARTGMV